VIEWIIGFEMVATNRITGHSPGFFSVYTLPPNQAPPVESQKRINARRNQIPPERDVIELICAKPFAATDISSQKRPSCCNRDAL